MKSEDPAKDREIKKLNELVAELGEQKTKADKLIREQKLRIAELESMSSQPLPQNPLGTPQSPGSDQALVELRGTVAGLQDVLAQKDLEIKRFGEQIALLKDSVAQKESELRRLSQQIPASKDSIAPSNSDSERLNEQISLLQDTIARKDSQIKQLNEGVAPLQDAIAQKDSDIRKLTQQLVPLQTMIGQKDTEIRQLGEQIGPMQDTIAQKDSQIRKLIEQLSAIQASPKNPETVKPTDQPGSQSDALALRDSEIKRLGEKINNLEDALAQKDSQIKRLGEQMSPLQNSVAQKDQQLQKLTEQIAVLLRQNSLANSKISELQSRLNRPEGATPTQYISEPAGSDGEEDLQADLRKFSMIKKLVENHYHPKPSSVNVTKNPGTKDFVIDVQFEDPAAPKDPPTTPGSRSNSLRKRIILPVSVFNGISRVRIDSNASTADGGPSSDRIYRQSFEGPVRKTETISTDPKDGGEFVQVDPETAGYFSLNKEASDRPSLGVVAVPGFVLEKKISPDLGKEYQLVQALFNPNFYSERQETPSNNKSLIKIEKYQGGTKSSESSTLVDPAKVKEMKDQMEEQVMNDIINLLENQKDKEPDSRSQSPGGTPDRVVSPASLTPKSGKPILPEYVYRQTQIEDGGSARNIDKVKLPNVNIASQVPGASSAATQPEILQKVTVKPLEISQVSGYTPASLQTTPKGQRKASMSSGDPALALVRIEGPGATANKKIEYYRYEKNSDGVQTLVPIQPSQAEKDEIDLLSKSNSDRPGPQQMSPRQSNRGPLGRSDLSFGGQDIGIPLDRTGPSQNQNAGADIKFAQAVITNPLILESLTETSIFKLKSDPATGSLVLEHLTKQTSPGGTPVAPADSRQNVEGRNPGQSSQMTPRQEQSPYGYTPQPSQREPFPSTQRSTLDQGGDLLQRIAGIGQQPSSAEASLLHSVSPSVLEKFTIPLSELSDIMQNPPLAGSMIPPSNQELEIQKTTHTPAGQTRSELVRLDVNQPDKKATVELLGVREPAQVWSKDAHSQTRVDSLLEQLGGMGDKLKDEAVKVLIQSTSAEGKSANMNKDLCEFLYLFFNPDELQQAAKKDPKADAGLLTVRQCPELANGVKEFERVEIIDEPGEMAAGNSLKISEVSIVPKRIGLVTQRFKIEPSVSEQGTSIWKVTKEICDPRGLVHIQTFDAAGIDRNSLPQKNITPSKLKNLDTQKSTTECKKIKLPNGTTKYCLSTFEVPKIPNRIMKGLEVPKPGQPTEGTNIMLTKTSPTGEFIAEKHNVPIPGVCYAELVEKSSVNLSNLVYGITVSFLPSGGAILEELGPSQTNKDGIDTVQRVIMGDAEQFEKVEEAAKQQKTAPEVPLSGMPSFAGITSVLQKVDPRIESRDRDQRILREKIKGAHKVTEDIIIPQAREYVVRIPSCLEKYDVFVKQREYKNPSVKDDADRDVNGLDTNPLLRDLGGLLNLDSLLSEISASPQELAANPIFTIIRPDQKERCLTAERFVVQNNSGPPLSNIKLIERVKVSRPNGGSGPESLVAQKEIPAQNYTMSVSKYKFSGTTGIPLPNNQVKKIFENSQTVKVTIDPYSPNPFKPEGITERFSAEDAQGEYLRLLYACHEFLENYLIVVGDDHLERKVEFVRVGETLVPKIKEVNEVTHTKGTGLSANRVVLEPGETIEESIMITLKGTDGDKSGTKKAIQTEGLSKTMMKLKRKVRTVRSAVGIKLKDPLVEDALDTLVRQKLNGELEDLLRLVHQDSQPASATFDQLVQQHFRVS